MFVQKIEIMGDSGHAYEITVHPGNVLYCSCPAWQYSHKAPADRRCKHIAFAAKTLVKS